MFPSQRVDTLRGVGPEYAKRLKEQGIGSINELLLYAPFRYENLMQKAYATKTELDKLQFFVGRVHNLTPLRSKKSKIACRGVFEDESGSIPVVWFHSAYVFNFFKKNERVVLVGKVSLFGGVPTLVSPNYFDAESESPHYGRFVPIYHEFQGVTSKWLRVKIWEVLGLIGKQELKGLIPEEYFLTHNLPRYHLAIKNLHFPEDEESVLSARKRLAMDELVYVMIRNLYERRSNRSARTVLSAKNADAAELADFVKSLPFNLSASQLQVLQKIEIDFKSGGVNRLLIGDVGSGKTVIAVGLMYLAIKSGLRAVIMAPTQILAAQHADSIGKLLSTWGFKTVLVSGESKEDVGQADVVVGTHALLYRRLSNLDVGVVVVDEQHRFGVLQREELRTRFGDKVHFLSMTATPIPRTLSLVGIGHLDVSYIERRPDGRQSAKTMVVPHEKRERAYLWLKEKIALEGGQLFVVCPFISPSETLESVQAASSVYEYLKSTVFAEMKIELLHGGMSSEKKEQLLGEFSQGNFEILVTTPVVEVGIDIPQAKYIAIESADRFGLAQLHQLRGRVGRRGQESYCLLIPGDQNQNENVRLRKMVHLDDGFELAKFDLQNRGAGMLAGTEQHGFRQFRFADIADEDLVDQAMKIATEIDLEIVRGKEREVLEKIANEAEWAKH